MDLGKLSRLQRWILYAAFDNRSVDPAAPKVDLYNHEILAGYFGFPMRWYDREPLHSHPGAHRFDREQIGRERYDAAQASVSRAVKRLEARGLVERYAGAASRWAGLRLTDAGFEAAPMLDQQRVRTMAGLPSLNRLGQAPAWLPAGRRGRTLRWPYERAAGTALRSDPPRRRGRRRSPAGGAAAAAGLGADASPEELAEAEGAARAEEMDALEEAGQTGEMPPEEARRILGIPARRRTEEYMTADEVRQLLGMPR